MKFPIRATIALALTLSGLLGVVGAGAATSSLVKIVQGKAYGFNAVTAIGSNGANVWVANSGGNSVTEIDASTGAKLNVFKKAKFGFDGPSRLSDDWTHVWVANDAGNSVTELNAITGALVRVIKGSTYKLHGTGQIASNGIDVWISNLRGTTLAEVNAMTGSFVKDVKVSSIGLTQVNALASDSKHVWAVDSNTNAVAELERRIGDAGEGPEGQGVPLRRSTGDHLRRHAHVGRERSNQFAHRSERQDGRLRPLRQGQELRSQRDDLDCVERRRRLGDQPRYVGDQREHGLPDQCLLRCPGRGAVGRPVRVQPTERHHLHRRTGVDRQQRPRTP